VFPRDLLAALDLPPEAFTLDGVEYYGAIGYLKAGLQLADRLTTVSPTYALEIQSPEAGMGLDGVLRARSRQLSGILNGIDEEVWNPATDARIVATYGVKTLAARARNKQAVRRAKRNGYATSQGDSRKRLLQGAALGAVLTIVVGFNWTGHGFGWVTAGTADKLARERAQTAVIAVLGPACAAKFNAQTDATAKKAALAQASSWDRRKLFADEWVALPGSTYPNSDLVDLCASLILTPQAAALK
jgi:hypothetical protein